MQTIKTGPDSRADEVIAAGVERGLELVRPVVVSLDGGSGAAERK